MARPTPLRLLSPLHQATRQIALHLEERVQGAQNECHLLSYLRSYAPCPVGEVGRVFGLKGSTLTGMLDRLEQRALLAREVDPEDRRSFLVRLTSTGEREADVVNRVVRDFERRVLTRCAARDLAGFERVMAAIAEETQVRVRPPNVRPQEEA